MASIQQEFEESLQTYHMLVVDLFQAIAAAPHGSPNAATDIVLQITEQSSKLSQLSKKRKYISR